MKLLPAVFLALVLPGIASGQMLSTEDMIKRIIDTGAFEGQMQKHIGVMGDSAAVAVTRVVAGRKLSASEIDSVLVVLTSSFADPRFVEIVPDRQPRTALFVLQYLDSSTKDPELKKRIGETRDYIQRQYAKAMQDSPKHEPSQ